MRRLVVLVLMLQSVPLLAEYSFSSSACQMPWLSRNTGVRPAAMADAFTGLADDINAVFYNPAGLGTLHNNQLMLIHEQGVAEIFTETFAFTHGTAGGNMAWTFQYHYAPDTREISGGILQNALYSYRNLAASLSYGRKIWRWINGGFTIRYARADEPGRSFNAVLADLGLLFIYDADTLVPNLNFSGLGISVQNIIPGFQYQDKPSNTDLKFRCGMALGYLNMMNLALEVEDTEDKSARFRIGYEIFPFYFLALRTGYEFNPLNTSALDGLSAGAGVGSRTGYGTLAFDIAARWRQSTGFTVDMAMNWTFNRPYYYTVMEDRIYWQKKLDDEMAYKAQKRAEERQLRKEREQRRKEDLLKKKEEELKAREEAKRLKEEEKRLKEEGPKQADEPAVETTTPEPATEEGTDLQDTDTVPEDDEGTEDTIPEETTDEDINKGSGLTD